jgi:2,5-diketo-D-gluconate reductase A
MSDAPEVPLVPLPGGGQMPIVGLGTWRLGGDDAETAVTAALATGYRHIDTAVMYGNELEVGRALAASGLGRDEVFLTTKLRPSDAGREADVLRKSLRDLRTEYVDLWLVHWPPDHAYDRRALWNEVRRIRDEGLVKDIGVSNFELSQIDDLIESTGEAPAVNQIRWSPSWYDSDVLTGHKARGIPVEGYSPLKDTDLADPVITEIAGAHGVTPAQVVLRWHLEHGITVIPKSQRAERMAANLNLFGFSLTEPEVARMDQLGSS